MTSQSPTGQMDKAMAETPKATPDTAKPAIRGFEAVSISLEEVVYADK